MGRKLRATGQLTRASFQALIQSAAMAYHMTRAARGRACAGLRLAWQLVVTLPTRRLGLLPPALWSAPSGALVRRRLPRALAQLGTRTATALRSIALNGVAPRRPASALRSGWAMSRPVLALNLSMAGLSVFFSIRLGHALFSPDLQSPSRTARPVAVAPPRNHDVVPNSRSPRVYDVIATRTIFHPNRSEPTRSEAIAPILPPAPTLALYGVVINGDTRLAYLQDLATKQMFGYTTGDKLAGGQVERIEPDRVVIMRADGPIEVMLHRPREPLPVVSSPEEDSPRRSRGRQE